MVFYLYLAFVALAYLRPMEAFAPELGIYRPMMILGLVALAAAVVPVLDTGRTAARKLHFVLMLALLACISLSKIANGWAGGAAVALSDFSTSALLFVLTLLNVTSIPRRRSAGRCGGCSRERYIQAVSLARQESRFPQ